jgi:hypothetical protein
MDASVLARRKAVGKRPHARRTVEMRLFFSTLTARRIIGSWVEDYTTARSHSSFWTTRRRHSPPNISPQLAITLRHPMLRSWPVAHIAPESIPTAVVPTAAGWSSVTGNRCPTASAKTSCDDYSTCDQGIHAPPPSRLQRYFHAETVLRPRR